MAIVIFVQLWCRLESHQNIAIWFHAELINVKYAIFCNICSFVYRVYRYKICIEANFTVFQGRCASLPNLQSFVCEWAIMNRISYIFRRGVKWRIRRYDVARRIIIYARAVNESHHSSWLSRGARTRSLHKRKLHTPDGIRLLIFIIYSHSDCQICCWYIHFLTSRINI